MKNKFLAFVMVMAMALTMMPGIALAFTMPTPVDDTITVDISNADQMVDFSADYESTFVNKAAINGYTLYINIKADIDMSGKVWTPIYFNSYPAGIDRIVLDGGNHTISNLGDMLFSGTWTGEELTIKNLTLDKANITGSVNNVGAFVGGVSATEEVNITNCKLTNSVVSSPKYAGGFIGYAAGYSGNDGPVFTTVTIQNCEVKGSTITGGGSTGGVVGHATGDAWTAFTVSGGEVSNNTITCTDDDDNKAGDIMGTIGAAQSKTTNGVIKEGSVTVNTTAANNVVKSNGVEINRIFGRFGTPGSKLSITGGNYDTTREENSYNDLPNTNSVDSEQTAVFDGEVDPNAPASTGSGISVKYNGGNSFSTSKSDVPTGVEIDGVAVPFSGTGSNFTVGCVDPGAKWVTVRWNSTSVTTNFTPDALVECSVSIPKTGDMPVWAAVLALFGF